MNFNEKLEINETSRKNQAGNVHNYGFETHLRDVFKLLPISFQMQNDDDMWL